MNFRKYKKAHKLLKQPYGINWYNKGWRVSFWNK